MTTNFFSNDHIRYEQGKDVSGHNKGCKREVTIVPNDDYEDAYTVTIYNLDSYPKSEAMAGKRMKIVNESSEKIELRGFGNDALGFSFEDYAMTLYLDNGKVKSITGHMLERGVDIAYLFDASIDNETSEIVLIAEKGLQSLENNDFEESVICCQEIVDLISNDMSFFEKIDLKNIGDLRKVGTVLYKTTQQLEKNSYVGYETVLLCAYLVNLIDYKISPGNEATVEARIKMVNKQPSFFYNFIKSFIIPLMEDTLIKEGSPDQLAAKLYWLLEAEILTTSFLKDYSNLKLLYPHYEAELKKGTFAPLTTTSEVRVAKDKLLNLLEVSLRNYFA